ncbi:MAG: NADH-quinone oxidoreductase subunit NuoH [Chitinophagales bacterium]|nr:NADH-quinone oxidoreductase subunit NuoH [Chitinophagales bacterium]MDW8419635.1 NADH-quinone oxidoreductase subunit NuoH [Chitinophagales bacterium]
MDTIFILEKSLIILTVFAITMLIALYSTFGERVFAAYFQDRLGPNRAGPLGLLQPLADGVKMFTKEDFIPDTPNKFLFIFGPFLFMTTALITSSVIPWGDKLEIMGRTVYLQAADINVAVLFVLGIVSIGVYGIMVGGWASNNKYSLLGAVRASSQMISYEIAMGLSIISVLMVSETLSLRGIVEKQHGFIDWSGKFPWFSWYVFKQPLAFLIFLVCAFAETNRTPFDLPECESELVGGYHTEYSSMKLGFYLFAEYINMFISSAIISLLFFGGFNYPGMDWVKQQLGTNAATLIGVGAMFAKTLFGIFFYMWVRWTVPRFRYDQLMNLGWKVLIPLAILNIVITGAVIILSGN